MPRLNIPNEFCTTLSAGASRRRRVYDDDQAHRPGEVLHVDGTLAIPLLLSKDPTVWNEMEYIISRYLQKTT